MAWVNGQADRIIYKQWNDSNARRYWDSTHKPTHDYVRPDADESNTWWVMACHYPGCFQCATIHNAAFGVGISASRAAKVFAQKGWYEDEETGEMYCQLHTPVQEVEEVAS